MNKILKIILRVLGGEQAANEFEKAGGGIQSLVKSVAGLAILQQAGQWLADFGKQAFDSAAKAERLGRATDNLSQAIGSSGEAMVSGIQAATGGTVDQLTAMESANKALMLGVVKSQDEMNKLAKMATVLGSAMGQDAATSIDNLVVGMGRMSPEILDNLGLTVEMEQATAAYAASVGKTVEQLTELERKQAFTNAVLAAGETRTASIGGQAEDTATKMERLGASYNDLQAALGKALTSAATESGALDYLNRSLEVWEAIALTVAANAENAGPKRAMVEGRQDAEVMRLAMEDLQMQAAALSKVALIDPKAKTELAAVQAKMDDLKAEQDMQLRGFAMIIREIDKEVKSEATLTAEIKKGNAAISARMNAEAVMLIGKQALAAAASSAAYVGAQQTRIDDYFAKANDPVEEGRSYGQSVGQSMADTLRSAVESQIKPTLAEVWSPGGEDARIDEWGRRAATIMTQGLNSEWIPALNAQFGGTDFWQPIQAAIAAGDTAGAQNLLGNLLTQNPQALWDKELIKQRVIQQLQQDNARTELINAIMAELSAGGMSVDAGQVEAAMGVSPVAAPVADSLATGLPGALAEKEIGAGMIAELGAQVGKADEELRGLTNAIAAGIESNLKAAMATTGASLLNVITSSVAATLGIELRP